MPTTEILGLSTHPDLVIRTSPHRQSEVIDMGKNVGIVRPALPDRTHLSPKDEVRRRQKAHRLHQKHLPEFTQPAQFAVLQGRNDSGDAPAIIRVVEKIDNCHPVTDMRISEIARDPGLCRDLALINSGYLRMLLQEGVVVDDGTYRGFNSAPLLNQFTYRLASSNILRGISSAGSPQTICDPDWFTQPQGSPIKKVRRVVGRIALFTFRIGFFAALSYYADIRNASQHQNQPEPATNPLTIRPSSKTTPS